MATNLPKKQLTFTIRDFYKEYSRECRKEENYPKREYIQYRNFIFSIFAELFRHILYSNWHFVLPYSLGEFYLKEDTRNTGKRVYSKGHSIQAGKAVYIFNNHTLRKTFRFKWDRSYTHFPTAKYYKFELISGREKLHRKYKVGRAAVADFLFSVGKNPHIKMPITFNSARKKLEEPIQ